MDPVLVHVHCIHVCAVNTSFFSAQKQSKPQSNSAVASGEESGEEEEEGAKESTKNVRATQKHDFSDEEDENEVRLSSESMYL